MVDKRINVKKKKCKEQNNEPGPGMDDFFCLKSNLLCVEPKNCKFSGTYFCINAPRTLYCPGPGAAWLFFFERCLDGCFNLELFEAKLDVNFGSIVSNIFSVCGSVVWYCPGPAKKKSRKKRVFHEESWYM